MFRHLLSIEVKSLILVAGLVGGTSAMAVAPRWSCSALCFDRKDAFVRGFDDERETDSPSRAITSTGETAREGFEELMKQCDTQLYGSFSNDKNGQFLLPVTVKNGCVRED